MDLKNYYFRPLGDDFEYAYKQATKTDAQKRRRLKSKRDTDSKTLKDESESV